MDMEYYLRNISENIRFYRKTLGLTQEQLANKLGGKKSLVSNYENRHSLPDILMICKLADIFEISIDEFMGRKLI